MPEAKDYTETFEVQDIESNKLMSILAYIGFLVLIPLFVAKESRYARFNTNQGLILLLVNVLVWIVRKILGWIPIIGALVGIVLWVISVLTLALAIIGIVNVCKGQAKELPLVGGIRILS